MAGKGDLTILRLAWRVITTVDPRCLVRLLWSLAVAGPRSLRVHRRRAARGVVVPAFWMVSVTDACNLRCQGCWVTRRSPGRDLTRRALDRIVRSGLAHGCRYYGILGGEPLLRPELLDVCAAHPRCLFQLFTNGLLLDRAVASRLRRLGNVTPLISIEGDADATARRRGSARVFERSLRGIDACVAAGLFTGVATSVCRANFAEAVDEGRLRRLIDRGVHYVWYYIYRPVGPDPHPELALTAEQIVELQRFLVTARLRWPILVVDAYWDEEGRALCPAAKGLSHHVGPGGDIEPCPPLQFACERIGEGRDLAKAAAGSWFLASFRSLASSLGDGCILMEHPARLAGFLAGHAARDTTGRGTGLDEFGARGVVPSHDTGARRTPEVSAFYRFAKRRWFLGLGAYG